MADMRDRLIELLDDIVCDYRTSVIADHLLANGVILPPCKVGDAVYDASEFFDGTLYPELYLLQDNTMEIKKTDNGYRFTYDGMFLTKDDIGKTLFLTREEAEKAIREKEK